MQNIGEIDYITQMERTRRWRTFTSSSFLCFKNLKQFWNEKVEKESWNSWKFHLVSRTGWRKNAFNWWNMFVSLSFSHLWRNILKGHKTVKAFLTLAIFFSNQEWNVTTLLDVSGLTVWSLYLFITQSVTMLYCNILDVSDIR